MAATRFDGGPTRARGPDAFITRALSLHYTRFAVRPHTCWCVSAVTGLVGLPFPGSYQASCEWHDCCYLITL
jgi:hypothetical protein